ncbi:GNAT family N-acetyltransferase [Nocardia uniformis]|uniref:GNAT family N-acetyltransferase n=1 Tax=Nocardia uniformis TaxID=53432 RepID=A0A849C5P5_9NOCA|nr:GNAT family N-acetyltransferase [Nocardia uniformis]NNH71665.1 GNAT family N-acetyltransferase [Nocardia uniformis]
MDPSTLSNGTVWLSPPTVHDIDTITACCQEPSLGRWTTMPVPYHREHAEAFITDIVIPGWAAHRPTWALRPSADGPVIGMIGLNPYRGPADEGAEIGFWLSPAARGRGLMTQAVDLVCTTGFAPDAFGFGRIEWRAIVGNLASAAVASRAGFHYEGLLRGGMIQRGVRHDTWVASRLPTDPPGPATDWPAEFP